MKVHADFIHRPLWRCVHTELMVKNAQGRWELPTVHEGGWGECSTETRSTKGLRTMRLYARKDDRVVWSRMLHYEHCIKYGRYGTISHDKASFYAIWLQGYEPVLVSEGQRRPNDCIEYDRAMDTNNDWRGIGVEPIDDYRVIGR